MGEMGEDVCWCCQLIAGTRGRYDFIPVSTSAEAPCTKVIYRLKVRVPGVVGVVVVGVLELVMYRLKSRVGRGGRGEGVGVRVVAMVVHPLKVRRSVGAGAGAGAGAGEVAIILYQLKVRASSSIRRNSNPSPIEDVCPLLRRLLFLSTHLVPSGIGVLVTGSSAGLKRGAGRK